METTDITMKIIILHDADARIEVLEVAGHLIGDDVETFLCDRGYSVNNITWLAAPVEYVPVVFHKYGTDTATGEETHITRETRLKDFTIHEQTKELKIRERQELVSALRKYGEREDSGFEVHFEGDKPVVAGYLYDEPADIVITAARVDGKGHLFLIGEDKENRGEPLDIDPDELFGGQLDYVTSSVYACYK